MDTKLIDTEVAELKELLKTKHIKISSKEIKEKLRKIEISEKIFPQIEQKALLTRLLFNYKHTKKKEIIILEEMGEKQIPATFLLGALAEDWPGMSNSILGIVHHKERNVSFVRGFTAKYKDKLIGVVILSFTIKDSTEYHDFLKEKRGLINKIKEASQGSTGKYLLLEDETIKFEIYNEIMKKVNKSLGDPVLFKSIEEKGEALKFVSSRSREYLEERKIKDLAKLVIDNHTFQNMIREGCCQEVIKIKNFETRYEKLTGITFVCREELISIEDFLKMLNFIVPEHNIKHHKSFVSNDGIMVYRLEIVDQYGNPLSTGIIRSIEKSLEKLIAISCSKEFTKLKSVGGFEHYARAIIPFLMEELKKTLQTQVFINVDKKTEFLIHIKLIIVSFLGDPQRIHELIFRLSMVNGIDINSFIPTKIYGNKIEVNIMKLMVNLADFTSIVEIYNSFKNIIKKLYGEIRDFDEGFREIYIKILNQLIDKLKTVNSALIRDIFFNIDELYRIEMPPQVLLELIKLCSVTVEESKTVKSTKILLKHKNMDEANRTLMIVSFDEQRRLLSKLIPHLKDFKMYFTKVKWNQRAYLLMILSRNNKALDNSDIQLLIDFAKGISR